MFALYRKPELKAMNIMDKIVEKRRNLISREGSTLGEPVPSYRRVPIVPFGGDPFIICEIKRRSPSRGDILPEMDAVGQAKKYIQRGIRNISVLTESEHFGGSLKDLMDIKQRFPYCAVLRKDFLLQEKDIEVSFRAGADAVLLIASILPMEELKRMYARAEALGMASLVEVHSKEDVEKVSSIKPAFTGINSRDLKSFSIDLAAPLKVKRMIDWPTIHVFESGITSGEDGALAFSSGFKGILVGEAVVKNPKLIEELKEMARQSKPNNFWERLYGIPRRASRKGPLVKVCGFTRLEDIKAADELGADLLGFVLAPSPRRVEPAFIRRVGETDACKVGVVVMARREKKLDLQIKELLNEGYLDAIQFHGEEAPEDCFSIAFPYYKALRIKEREDLLKIKSCRCPRVLIDAYSTDSMGGTGKRLKGEIVREASLLNPLWLAGGIKPDNVRKIIEEFKPELVDISSGLEDSPGIKNHRKIESFFKEIE